MLPQPIAVLQLMTFCERDIVFIQMLNTINTPPSLTQRSLARLMKPRLFHNTTF